MSYENRRPACSNNFHIDVHCRGEEQLRLSLDIALGEAPGRKAKAFIKKKMKTNSIAYGKNEELETLILLWNEEEGSTPFPSKLGLDQTIAVVTGFLDEVEPGNQPDHDGNNSIGFRVFNEDWGHVGGSPYGIVGIQPCWMMHGK